jgi:hypothetical protein
MMFEHLDYELKGARYELITSITVNCELSSKNF